MTPTITLFTSKAAPLNKRFDLDGDAIRKTTRAMLYEGAAQTVAVPDAEALRRVVSGLLPRQALSIGRLKERDQAAITTAQNADADRLARTRDYFTFPAGPGWLLWDYDDKTMPEAVRDRVAALGGPLEALFHIWPEARGGEYAVFPSSSDGVTAPGVASLSSSGRHGYFLVADISRAAEALRSLEARAWQAGLAWFALSKSGAVLERSIIDTAVGSPERLIFEAAPDLVAPVTREPQQAIVHRGDVLAMPDAPDVTDIRSAAREAIKPAAMKAEAAFVEDQAQKISHKTGASIAAAREVVRRRLKGGVLYDDDVIFGPGGAPVLVRDLLDRKPHGKGMPDPVEGPEYGLTTATFLWGAGYAEPRLISHAHGANTVYRFARYMTPGDIEAAESGAEALRLPEAADLPDGRETTLEAALRGADAVSALPVAVAVVDKLQNKVPHRMSAEQVMVFVMDNLPVNFTGKVEERALRDRLDFLVNKRKNAVLQRSDLPGQALERHDVLAVENLDHVSADLNGVTVVKAPMGAGKTQQVGRPLVEAAKAAGVASMAICHRITLTNELSRRLGLPDYQTSTNSVARDGVAVCLPSILRSDIAEALPTPKVVFVDEVAQVLQFLSESMCASSAGGNSAVYDRLAQVIRDAEAVLVADANLDPRTIHFLEKCRPGERFKIVTMPSKPNGKRAEVFAKSDPAIDRVAEELAIGGKVWLATEGQKKAEALAEMFQREGYRVLCITARTKLEGDAAAFLDNADAESRKYDLVVSSPAISSGLSVEHRGSPHFTLGAFIGAGTAIRPEDALQQLGRVRYLDRFVIGLDYSNQTSGLTVGAIRKGIEGAAEVEGVNVGWNDFDTFTAGVKAEDSNARSDFGAGLWWLLEREGWTLDRADDDKGEGRGKAAKEAYEEARLDALLSAELMDSHKAGLLQAMPRTRDQENRLEAHKIRLEMGKLDLTPDDIRRWDNGHGRQVRERFEDLTGADVPVSIETQTQLTARRFRVARRKLYAEMFAGIDLNAPISQADCELILNRIMQRPETYAAVRIVGPKYQARRSGKGGVFKPVQRPKQAGREVSDVLRRCGLEVVRSRSRKCPKTPSPSILREAVLGQNDNRQYSLTVQPKAHEAMAAWLERRSVFDLDAALALTVPPEPAQVVPADEVVWRRAEKAADRQQAEARRLRDVVKLAEVTRLSDLRPRAGNTAPEAAPAPEPIPEPRRRLIFLPAPHVAADPVREVFSHYEALSQYRVEADGVRLVWTAAMGDAVTEVFTGWRNISPNDPDAWI